MHHQRMSSGGGGVVWYVGMRSFAFGCSDNNPNYHCYSTAFSIVTPKGRSDVISTLPQTTIAIPLSHCAFNGGTQLIVGTVRESGHPRGKLLGLTHAGFNPKQV
jgi:hypothetical protein